MFIIDFTNRNTKVCPFQWPKKLAPKKLNHLCLKNEQQFKGPLLYLKPDFLKYLNNMEFKHVFNFKMTEKISDLEEKIDSYNLTATYENKSPCRIWARDLQVSRW